MVLIISELVHSLSIRDIYVIVYHVISVILMIYIVSNTSSQYVDWVTFYVDSAAVLLRLNISPCDLRSELHLVHTTD